MSSLNANGKRCADVWPDEEISYTIVFLSGFFSLITIPGNLLVLIVVFKNPNGKMRTPFNWFILNLAAADLFVGAVVEPLSVFVHIREGLGYAMKYHVYLRPVYFTFCTASVFSLGMLTIDRYIAITSPMKYRATLSNKRAAISSLVIWIISCGLPFLRKKIGFLWYFFVFGNACVLITFLVLVFSFVRVHLSLRARVETLDAMHSGGAENQAKNNALKSQAKVTKALMYMLLAFIFCYIPALVMIYLMNLCTACSCQSVYWFRDLSFLLVVLNSCINPFLYAWRLPNFKDAIKTLFKRNPRAPHLTDQRARTQATPQGPSTSDKKISSATTASSVSTEGKSVGFPATENAHRYNNNVYVANEPRATMMKLVKCELPTHFPWRVLNLNGNNYKIES